MSLRLAPRSFTGRSRTFPMMGRGGFSAMEVILVITIIAVTAGFSIPAYRSYFVHSGVDRIAGELEQGLVHAKTQAQAGVDEYGINVQTGVLFTGHSYAERDVSADQHIYEPQQTVTVTGPTDITFTCIDGIPITKDASGNDIVFVGYVYVSSTIDTGYEKTVGVDGNGQVVLLPGHVTDPLPAGAGLKSIQGIAGAVCATRGGAPVPVSPSTSSSTSSSSSAAAFSSSAAPMACDPNQLFAVASGQDLSLFTDGVAGERAWKSIARPPGSTIVGVSVVQGRSFVAFGLPLGGNTSDLVYECVQGSLVPLGPSYGDLWAVLHDMGLTEASIAQIDQDLFKVVHWNGKKCAPVAQADGGVQCDGVAIGNGSLGLNLQYFSAVQSWKNTLYAAARPMNAVGPSFGYHVYRYDAPTDAWVDIGVPIADVDQPLPGNVPRSIADSINDLYVSQNVLYAAGGVGLYHRTGFDGGGFVSRYDGGTKWTVVTSTPLDSVVNVLRDYNGQLYAGTSLQSLCPVSAGDPSGSSVGSSVGSANNSLSLTIDNFDPLTCGNFAFDAGETCSNCSQDLGPSCAQCGNGVPDLGETCANCPQDMGPGCTGNAQGAVPHAPTVALQTESCNGWSPLCLLGKLSALVLAPERNPHDADVRGFAASMGSISSDPTSTSASATISVPPTSTSASDSSSLPTSDSSDPTSTSASTSTSTSASASFSASSTTSPSQCPSGGTGHEQFDAGGNVWRFNGVNRWQTIGAPAEYFRWNDSLPASNFYGLNPGASPQPHPVAFPAPIIALAAQTDSVFPSCSDPAVPRSQPDASVMLSDRWVPNGPVYSMVREGNILYLGGRFSVVGKNTGQGVLIDETSGAVTVGSAAISGPVYASAPDGTGGWYVGGAFTHVGGTAQANLVHILGNGRVDATWSPVVNGTVRAIAVQSGTVYIGGDFTSVSGAARSYAAAITSGGDDAGIDFHVNAAVRAIVIQNADTVILGGDFTSTAALPADFSASYQLDGTYRGTLGTPSPVYALYGQGSHVYAGGNFGIHKDAGSFAAATDVGNVRAITGNGSNAFYVGADNTGTSLPNAFKLNNGGNVQSNWAPVVNDVVRTIGYQSSVVYIGGDFTQVNGVARAHIAALPSGNNPVATAWDPSASNAVFTLVPTPGSVFVGGDFTTVGALQYARRNLAAIDVTTDSVTSWSPNATLAATPDESFVSAVVSDGTYLSFGGNFDTAGGQPHANLARANYAGTVNVSWHPDADAEVDALALKGSTLYVGGEFTQIGGVDRRYAAAVADDGSISPWDPEPDRAVKALLVDRCAVFVGGFFETIGGARRSYLASLDQDQGVASMWDPHPDGWVNALARYDSTVNGGPGNPGIFVGGSFSTLDNQSRRNVGAFNSFSGKLTGWAPDPSGPVWSIVPGSLVSNVVYLGGSFTVVAGQSRPHAAAVLIEGAGVLPWNPSPDGIVTALDVVGDKVFLGGTFRGLTGLVMPKPNFAHAPPYDMQATTGDVCQVTDLSGYPSTSLNGRFTAFVSQASNLVPGDDNVTQDAFVYDSVSDDIRRVSIASDGAQMSGGTSLSAPSISADGRFIAFTAMGSNGIMQAFVHDRDTDENGVFDEPGRIRTTVVSVDDHDALSSGNVGDIDMSADGRFVVFTAFASNLVTPAPPTGHVYVHDRDVGATGVFDTPGNTKTILADVSSAGVAGNHRAYEPSISDDGHFVSFVSTADNVGGPANPFLLPRVYVRNRSVDGTIPFDVAGNVATTLEAADTTHASIDPAISADGQWVAYRKTNGVEMGGNITDASPVRIILRNIVSNTETVVADPASIDYVFPGRLSVSAHGEAVAYAKPGATGTWQVYRYDRQTAVTDLVSVAAAGGEADALSDSPALSDDGQVVVFAGGSNLVSPPQYDMGVMNVYRRDMAAATTTRVSKGCAAAHITYAPPIPSYSCVAYPSISTAPWIDDSDAIGYLELLAGGVWSPLSLQQTGFKNTQRASLVDPATQTATANWCAKSIPAGSYQVRATWPAYYDATTRALLRVYNGQTLEATVPINQQLAPVADATTGPTAWQDIGVFPTNGTLRVELSNTAPRNGAPTYSAKVIADAVWIAPAGPQSTDPVTVSAVTVTDITATTATLQWTTTVPADSQVGYGLTAAGSVAAYEEQTTLAGLVRTHVVTLTGLQTNTVYHFRVASATATATGASSDATFQTIDASPLTIAALSTQSVTPTGVTITWTTNKLANAQVEYGTTAAYGSTTSVDTQLTQSHVQSLVALQTSTLYHYRVTSTDGAGISVTSGDRTFTTTGTPVTACQPGWAGLTSGAAGPWETDGPVFATAVDATTLYLGGSFTTVAGVARNGLAALDRTTGTVLPWNPDTDGTVRSLLLSGSTLYIGGSFSQIGGVSRSCIGAVGAASGLVSSWNPTFGWSQVVQLLTPAQSPYVFVRDAGGIIVKIRSADAAVLGSTTAQVSGGSIFSAAIRDPNLFVSGTFTSIDGTPRPSGVAAFSLSTMKLAPWNVANTVIPALHGSKPLALAVSNSTLYLAGFSGSIQGVNRQGLAAVDVANGTLLPSFAPPRGISGTFTDDLVRGAWVNSPWLYVNGRSAWGQPAGPYSTLWRLDATTGALDASWNPAVSGGGANAVFAGAFQESDVYVGGSFTAVGGAPHYYLGHFADVLPPAGPSGLAPVITSIVQVSSISKSSATITWTTDTPSDQHVDFDLTGAPYDSAFPVGPTGIGTSHSVTLSGLNPSSTYHFAVRSANANGQVTSVDRTFVTLASVATPLQGWGMNGSVAAMTAIGSTLYIGGDFSLIGAYSGFAMPIVAQAGQSDNGLPETWKGSAAFPVINGQVRAAVSDGDEGWFVGGWFTRVGDQARTNLVHIKKGGVIDTAWLPSATVGTPTPDDQGGVVRAMVRKGTVLYIGGTFTQVNGQARNHLAALDVTDGSLLPWNPDADAAVYVLLIGPDNTVFGASTTVIAGGAFGTLGGKPRPLVGAIDGAGRILDWRFDQTVGGDAQAVYSLASGTVSGQQTLVLGGHFHLQDVLSTRRKNIAMTPLEPDTTPIFGPNMVLASATPQQTDRVSSVFVSGNVVYAVGSFDTVFGALGSEFFCDRNGCRPSLPSDEAAPTLNPAAIVTRKNAAAFQLSDGATLAWNPKCNGPANAVTVDGVNVYVGGAFSSVNAQPAVTRHNIAAFDTTFGVAQSWNPGTTDEVDVLVPGTATVSGFGTHKNILVGGAFTAVNPVERPAGLAALMGTGTPTTNRVTSWSPNLAAGRTTAITTDGTSVFVAGSYTQSSGGAAANILKIDASGNVSGFGSYPTVSPLSGVIATMVYSATPAPRLLLGGMFDGLNGTAGLSVRSHAASISVNGSIDSWNPSVNGPVRAIVANGNRVYVGGAFSVVGGLSRTGIAAVDNAAGAVLSSWTGQMNAGADVKSLQVSGPNLIVGGAFTALGGVARNNLGSLDMITTGATGWQPQPNAVLQASSLNGSTLFLGGAFTSVGAQARDQLASTDVSSNAPLADWAPSGCDAMFWNGSQCVGRTILSIVSHSVQSGLSVIGNRVFVSDVHHLSGYAY